MTDFHAELEEVLRLSRSIWVDVIRARIKARHRPHMLPRVFSHDNHWFAVVSWPENRYHWLLLPLIAKPDVAY